MLANIIFVPIISSLLRNYCKFRETEERIMNGHDFSGHAQKIVAFLML